LVIGFFVGAVVNRPNMSLLTHWLPGKLETAKAVQAGAITALGCSKKLGVSVLRNEVGLVLTKALRQHWRRFRGTNPFP
jgi:hypothetical protein